MVLLPTASATANGGTISPAANGWIWNLLSVASATALQKVSAPPHSVSSDFGKLEVSRHFSSGDDCAIAGAAIGRGRRTGAKRRNELTAFHAFPLQCFLIRVAGPGP